MPVGLLVEREVAKEHQNGGDGLPTLFSLLHPIGELSPVTLRRPATGEVHLGILQFLLQA